MLTDVKQHSLETIAGKKQVEALGAIELLAGDDITLASLGNMQLATAGELIETVGKLRHSVAAELQRIEAPKHWAGTDSVNIYNLLDQLIQCVAQLAEHCANHTHLAAGRVSTVPDLTINMVQSKTEADNLHSALSPLLAD